MPSFPPKDTSPLLSPITFLLLGLLWPETYTPTHTLYNPTPTHTLYNLLHNDDDRVKGKPKSVYCQVAIRVEFVISLY
jgi:hypothetical protein